MINVIHKMIKRKEDCSFLFQGFGIITKMEVVTQGQIIISTLWLRIYVPRSPNPEPLVSVTSIPKDSSRKPKIRSLVPS